MTRNTKVTRQAKEIAAKVICFVLIFTLFAFMGEGVTAAHLFPERLENTATEHTVNFYDLPFVNESEWDIVWDDEIGSTDFNDMPFVDYEVQQMAAIDFGESDVVIIHADEYLEAFGFEWLDEYGNPIPVISFYDMALVDDYELFEMFFDFDEYQIWDDPNDIVYGEPEYCEDFLAMEFLIFDLLDDYGNVIDVIHIDDMWPSDEIWWEDDFEPDNYIGINPLNSVVLPSVSVSRGTTQSTSVDLSGSISNAGGGNITFRGFWIRRDGVTAHSEHGSSGTNMSFSTRINGLLPNTTYHVRAVARNSAGTGQSSAISFRTPPLITVPGSPQNFTVTAGVGSASLSWSAPSSNGGTAVIWYEVSRDGGQTWVTASGTSHTFMDLPSGSRTFSVRARNSAGASAPASRTVTIQAAPTVTRPTLTVTASQTPPLSIVTLNGTITNNGGGTITDRGFQVRRPGATGWRTYEIGMGLPGFSLMVSNLQPGTTYEIRAFAVNSAGRGYSPIRDFRTNSGAPSAPQDFAVTTDLGRATLTWRVPSHNGGSIITRYEVSRDGGATWVTASSNVSHTFTGVPGGWHDFRVRAVNAVATGNQASLTRYVPTAPLVNPPTLTTTFVTVTSTAVELRGNITNNGGANIIDRGFWIRAEHEANAREVWIGGNANAFIHRITGLTPGVRYYARAVARNNGIVTVGQGNAIEFRTLTAFAPGAPQNFTVTPGDRRATLNWTAPASNGGAEILRYEVSSNNGTTWMPVGMNTSHTFTGLTNGATLTFRVRAVNAVGPGDNVSVTARVSYITVTLNPNGGAFGVAPLWDELNEEFVFEGIDGLVEHGDFGMFNFDGNIEWYGDYGIVGLDYVSPAPLSMLPATHQVAIGTPIDGLPSVFRPGYTLVGWAFSPVPIDGIIITQIGEVHHGITLFAIWQRNPILTNFGSSPFVYNQNLTVTWELVAGATYRIILRDMTDNARIVLDRQVSGTSFTIPASYLVANRTYLVEVEATTRPMNWVSRDMRTIVVRERPGIRVTVMTPDGQRVPGALVQFMRTTGSSGVNTFIETGSDGVAFFANAPVGRYTVNVTHPFLVSSSHTSTRVDDNDSPDFIHVNGTAEHPVTITMRAPDPFGAVSGISPFLGLQWGPMLDNMGTPANPTYYISSVYGWREFRARGTEWHDGIDIIPRMYPIYGTRRPLLAPFDGEVAGTFESRYGGTAGFGIIMEYFCSELGAYFYVRYLHMYDLPKREDGTQLRIGHTFEEGERVGFIGNTPFNWSNSENRYVPTSPHLHVDVHINFLPSRNSSRLHTIDPRAFMTPNILMPWHVWRGYTVHRQTNAASIEIFDFDNELMLEDEVDSVGSSELEFGEGLQI